jgi:hypothetical protein
MAEQRIRKAVAGNRVQITEIQLAAQVRIAFEASKIGVDCVFMPVNMLFSSSIYRNAREVTICPKRDLPLGNDDPSRQERHFRAVGLGAQDELIFQSEHGSTRLNPVDNVTGNTSTLELPVRVDKE